MDLFGKKTRSLLNEREEEIRRLLAELEAEREARAHTERLLAMKEEECEALSKRCARMEKRCEYADEVEAKIGEIEEKVTEFAALKTSYLDRIKKLRMERDEAQALLKARGALDDTISPIDFTQTAVTLDTPAIPNPPQPANSPKSLDDTDYQSDWYEPLPG